ncbi:MAG: hypothetical protein M1818_003701 [Claussenomyces sp. TS43310]|nr:MAG: hypothetical protein M1818_003701 [Claussenomyces sp. TS43310]
MAQRHLAIIVNLHQAQQPVTELLVLHCVGAPFQTRRGGQDDGDGVDDDAGYSQCWKIVNEEGQWSIARRESLSWGGRMNGKEEEERKEGGDDTSRLAIFPAFSSSSFASIRHDDEDLAAALKKK